MEAIAQKQGIEIEEAKVCAHQLPVNYMPAPIGIFIIVHIVLLILLLWPTQEAMVGEKQPSRQFVMPEEVCVCLLLSL